MKNIVPIKNETGNITYSDHASRMCRHFVTSNEESFSDKEILELFLFACGAGVKTRAICDSLISKFGNFSNIVTAPITDLNNIDGINEQIITALKLLRESSIRLLRNDIAEPTLLNGKKSLINYCKARMCNLKFEQFFVFYLDKKYQLICEEIISSGSVDSTPLYPRKIVKKCLETEASFLILVHNHPSGDPTPSEADKRATRDISSTLAGLDIFIKDHLIIGGKHNFSFYENGLL